MLPEYLESTEHQLSILKPDIPQKKLNVFKPINMNIDEEDSQFVVSDIFQRFNVQLTWK